MVTFEDRFRVAWATWLAGMSLAALGVGAHWWAGGRTASPSELGTRLAVLAVVVGTVAAAVTAAWSRWKARSLDRADLEARLREAVLEVTGGPPAKGVPLRVHRWEGRQPRRVEVRWPRSWSPEAASSRGQLRRALAEVVPGEWSGTYRPRRPRWLLTFDDPDPAETARQEVEARLDGLARKAIKSAQRVKITEWVEHDQDKYDQDAADEEPQPRQVEVTYTPGPFVASERYRAAVQQIVNATLPGRWRCEWDSENDRVVFALRPGLPDLAVCPVPEPVSGFVPYAVTEDGQTHGWDLNTQSHCLLIGPTGGGKTSTARAILINALRLPEGAEAVLIDPKRIELNGFHGYPGVRRVATTSEEIADTLVDVQAEMERRYELIQRDPQAKKGMPRLFVFLDEFFVMRLRLTRLWAKMKERDDGIKRTGRDHPAIGDVPELAALARSCKVHLIVGIQRPDAEFLEGAARDNFTHRISMTRLSPVGARMTWGEGSSAGTDLPTRPGRAIATSRLGEPAEVQVWWMPDPDPRLVADLTPEEVTLLDRLRPEREVSGTELPDRTTVAAEVLAEIGAPELSTPLALVKPDAKGDGISADSEPKGAEPGGLAAAAEEQWTYARAEELVIGDAIEQDGVWVELTEVGEDDSDEDEDLVYLEWEAGAQTLPAEESLKRLVGAA